MRSQSSRPGVTLIEVLVGIAFIAVLLGILLPGIQAVRQAADRAHCANNLHQIGIAYHTFLDAKGGRSWAFKSDSGWMDQLKPYLEKNEEVFVCLSNPGGASATFSESVQKINLNTELPYNWVALKEGDLDTVEVAIFGSGMSINLNDASENATSKIDTDIATVNSILYWLNPDNVGQTSYGVNPNSSKLNLANDSQKVLALDYTQPVMSASIGDGSNVWPTAAATRHGGTLNVLFMDGSVQRMDQGEINPTVQATYTQFWLPWSLR